MVQIDDNIYETNGIRLHTIHTKKFKTNSIILKLKAPLTKNTVTKRALLPNVLQSGTKKLPSKAKLMEFLDDLYGASLNIDVSKKGEYHIISFRLDIVNEKYLKDNSPLLEKAMTTLSDILLAPITEDNGFNKNTVEKEKKILNQKLQSVFDDKMKYANKRLIEEMCEHEPYRLEAQGIKEDINNIDATNLYEYYEHVLLNDEIDLYVVGDIGDEHVRQLVATTFVFSERRNNILQKSNVTTKVPSQEKECIEEQDINQGKLHIGYRTNIAYADQDYYSLQVFNGLFGGFSHSKLFINVREKASLAYYAASRLESHKGLLLVMSGIESSNYNQTVEIIKKQMEEMRAGNFTEDEIVQTKAVIKNQILETLDTSNGLVELLYHAVISGVTRPINDWFEKIDLVNHQEIVDVANKVQLDTIYFLKEAGVQ